MQKSTSLKYEPSLELLLNTSVLSGMAKPGEYVPAAVLLALFHPAHLPGQRGQQVAHRCTPTRGRAKCGAQLVM